MTVTYEKKIKFVEDCEPGDCIEISNMLYEITDVSLALTEDIYVVLTPITSTLELGSQPLEDVTLIMPTTTRLNILK